MRKRIWKTISSAVLAIMLFVSSSISTSAAASYPQVDGYANVTTIKGQQTLSNDIYGSQHAFQNFDITKCYIPDDYAECGIPYYEFEGKQYRFYDYTYAIPWVKARNREGKTANVQFMISWETRDNDGYGSLVDRRLLIDEAARTQTGALYYAPATTGEGRQILRAFWSWFMDSLAKEGAHVDNLILGNEVNAHNEWHYSGNVGTQATVEKYASAFYDMRKIVRNYSDKTRCSICMDHTWNYYDGVIGAKEYIRIFHNSLTNLNGGTPVDDWCMALHLYPSVLFEPAIWTDHPPYPSNMNALSENAGWVDGKNLSYITNYIKNTYGENHRIMLTEQGFTTYRGDDIQAASLAYSYYAAKYDPMVDCFILYTSTTADSRLDFSISGRKAEDVFLNIENADQQERLANMLLPTIGVSSWSQIIPNYGQTVQRKQYQGSDFVPLYPSGIVLNYTSVSLTPGQTHTVAAVLSPSGTIDRTITWTSSNTTVAEVNNGVITAKGGGTATITASTANGLQAQCTVNVMIYPTGITLDRTEATMIVGDTLTLNANIAPSNATETAISWSTSNSAIGTVNNGVITLKAGGTMTVTAQTVNGYKAHCTIYSIIDNNPDNPFGDVNSLEGWEYPFVKYVYDKQYMNGKGDIIPGKIKFDPNGTLLREEFAQVLYNIESNPTVTYSERFPDVPNNEWYTNAVIWAAENNIVAGYNNGKFGKGDNITREQLAVMLYKYATQKGYDITARADLSTFGDYDKISEWALKEMQWANANGIVNGTGSNLEPGGYATRAQCAAMISNFLNKFEP